MLILFDIDATLLRTGGVGVKAMVDAGRALFGDRFTADGIDFAGRLDPLILRDMLVKSGVEPTAANMAAMRTGYGKLLPGYLSQGSGFACPGVQDLLASLDPEPDLALGLLTGNFAETGLMKLAACKIESDRFTIRVWGDDSPHDPPARDHLPAVGLRRYRERFDREVHPGKVTIIGDTPHDVRCARAHGCRSLGVATGKFSVDELQASGADRVVSDLRETAAIKGWLLSP